ncbi:MAG: ABC transporter ATP-binding protein [Firmicutes bacterium]|nr:ABC transporter ATP-binding protein [Bacillota bacterium]
MGRMPARPQNVRQTLKRLLAYLAPQKMLLLIVLPMIILSSAAAVAGSLFLKPLFNDYVVPFIGQQNPDLSGFISLMTVMAVIYLVGVAATYIYNRLMVVISSKTLAVIRKDMFAHMEKLPLAYFDKHPHGELMSRYTSDTDALHDALGMGLPTLLSCSMTVIGVFLAMLVLSPLLTLLIIVMLGVMFLSVKLIGRKSGFYFKKQQQAIGKVNGYLEEMIEGQKVVRVFGYEQQAARDFTAINNDLCATATNANTFANIMMPVMANLSYVNYALTAVLGAILGVGGLLDLGSLASFLQLTRQFGQPISQISQQFNGVLLALAGAERIFAVLDETPENDEGEVTLVRAEKTADGWQEETNGQYWLWKRQTADGIIYTEVKGDVRLEDVSFGYLPEKTVLHNVSFYAKPGQKIALVGSTGSGKTTITNLINRFYEVENGHIIYDGIDTKQICKPDLRRSMAFVLQDSHLFSGSIKENIRYGRLNATDAEVEAAARLANADGFIRHLPQGYDTVISGNGGNLSQGQRQLLTIARAMLADTPVIVLDEATSSVDTRTEQLIEKAMDRLMDNRTVFVIAHRLSTVRNANAILVLENGRIVERGDHDDLLRQKGRYYQLYNGLFELE